MRTKFEGAASSQQEKGQDNYRRDQGAARAISSFIDPSLNWADLASLKEAAGDMKVVLKGVQCWEDAVMAAEAGCDGVVLSNHGWVTGCMAVGKWEHRTTLTSQRSSTRFRSLSTSHPPSSRRSPSIPRTVALAPWKRAWEV